MTTFEVYRFSLWFYKKKRKGFGDECAFLGTNARSSHILKTQGFWDAGSSGAARAAAHWGGAAYTKNARGFGDEREFVAYT